MATKLADADIQKQLAQLDGWSLDQGKLHKAYKLADFKQAMGFIVRIGLAAEQMDHHPELFNVYNNVKIWLETHDVGGLSERDFQLAGQIDKLR